MAAAKKHRYVNVYTQAIHSLQKALASFGNRGQFWIQGYYGRVREGRKGDWLWSVDSKTLPKYVSEPKHVLMMCSMGAVMRADGPGERVAIRLLALTAKELYPHRTNESLSHDSMVIEFNDDGNTTFRDVRKVFTKAMERATVERRKSYHKKAKAS